MLMTVSTSCGFLSLSSSVSWKGLVSKMAGRAMYKTWQTKKFTVSTKKVRLNKHHSLHAIRAFNKVLITPLSFPFFSTTRTKCKTDPNSLCKNFTVTSTAYKMSIKYLQNRFSNLELYSLFQRALKRSSFPKKDYGFTSLFFAVCRRLYWSPPYINKFVFYICKCPQCHTTRTKAICG